MSNRVVRTTENGSYHVEVQEAKKFGKNYDLMFDKIMSELKEDDRVQTVMFDYDDQLGGNTVFIYTKRCTLFHVDKVFTEDHSNDNDVIGALLSAWNKLPLEESDKEQYSGLWKTRGKKIKFNRIWNNYRFSDEECEALLDGQHIEFRTMAKDGKEKNYRGLLDEQEYQGFRFFGFKMDGFALPDEWFGHKFTENEKTMLKAGKEVKLSLTSKAGKPYMKTFVYSPAFGMKEK